jgi:hypothetical protein
MAWHHEPVAPWQTPEWIEQMRGTLRPNAFLRLIENRWVSSESTFVPIEWWDACVNPDLRPLVKDTRLPVWLGVDASVKRDSTAIVACTWDDETNRVRLVWHRIFQPSPKDPLDFEATIEKTLIDSRDRFDVKEIRFDPYQLVAVSQRLVKAGLPMVEFPQSVPNLTEASTNLYEVLKGRSLEVYPDDGNRLSISRAVALETSRGWRIAKEKVSHKIDFVVALAQAALGAVQAQGSEPGLLTWYRERFEAPISAPGANGEPEESNELVDEYERIRDGIENPEPACARCGQLIHRGTSRVSTSDGRACHPECHKSAA